jgi:glutaredoxin 3
MKFQLLVWASLLLQSSNGFMIRSGAGTSLARSVMSSNPKLSTTFRYMSKSTADYVKTEIGSSDVVVFSKTYCPYCTATKNLMKELKIKAKVIELDEVNNGAAIQDSLRDLTGQRTVPNVFIKGEHLGGNDVTQAAAKSGKLQKMLGM